MKIDAGRAGVGWSDVEAYITYGAYSPAWTNWAVWKSRSWRAEKAVATGNIRAIFALGTGSIAGAGGAIRQKVWTGDASIVCSHEVSCFASDANGIIIALAAVRQGDVAGGTASVGLHVVAEHAFEADSRIVAVEAVREYGSAADALDGVCVVAHAEAANAWSSIVASITTRYESWAENARSIIEHIVVINAGSAIAAVGASEAAGRNGGAQAAAGGTPAVQIVADLADSECQAGGAVSECTGSTGWGGQVIVGEGGTGDFCEAQDVIRSVKVVD